MASGEEQSAPAIDGAVIELSSSDSDSEAVASGRGGGRKRSRGPTGESGDAGGAPKKASVPPGFLDHLPMPPPKKTVGVDRRCRQFWKAGDFERSSAIDSIFSADGMDHVRVHPKFLHSNATSHKWALGALAELLDNSLDEVSHGATYVNIDMMTNKKDGSKMLLVEDNGGGMDPDKMRQCMSLGYSAKSKIANTIGQYGNGFKTSTMRLGADVIVFSRSRGRDGNSPTQSIGLLSYTYLINTGQDDIVVPMLDYEKEGKIWKRIIVSSTKNWNTNLKTIIDWSPYSSEADLLEQFNQTTDQGTRVVIYNLWEDDQGELELDFVADKHDIQVRGVNRDEKKIEMAKQFPNSKHFLTYRHSLRSYASILYLHLPRSFRIILRGKEIEHHNIVTDMMMKKQVTYRPNLGADAVSKDLDMIAVVMMGFVRDAKHHVDVQGFNVYYKNRLIKPFWRVWSPPGSDGRGVIGVLEANFVEPAHDKQDFERTIVLSRLEARLVQMQRSYWSMNCHKIGYAPRMRKRYIELEDGGCSHENPQASALYSGKGISPNSSPPLFCKSQYFDRIQSGIESYPSANNNMESNGASPFESAKTGVQVDRTLSSGDGSVLEKLGRNPSCTGSRVHKMLHDSDISEFDNDYVPSVRLSNGLGGRNATFAQEPVGNHVSNVGVTADTVTTRSQPKAVGDACHENCSNIQKSDSNLEQLKAENEELRERLRKMEESMLRDLQDERDKCKSLAEQLETTKKRLEEATKEQEALENIYLEERKRRDREEANVRNKLKEAHALIQQLQNQLGST